MADALYYLAYINLGLLILVIGASLAHLVQRRREHLSLARFLHLGLFISLTGTLLLLLKAFLDSDFQYQYVVEYSATTTPAIYKLSGLWAGRQGTLVIWTWAAVGALGWEDLRHQRPLDGGSSLRRAGHTPSRRHGRRRQRRRGRDPVYLYTRLIGLAFIGGLAAIQLALNPFEPTPGVTPTEGMDLNPLLQTFWMAIHPPIVFISYGLIVPVLAAGLAFLLTHSADWVKVALRWARWSWVGMGLSLFLGGYWAYVTLGWGGFWAWDPVETASLLPWIGLTAFLHIALMFKRKRNYAVLGPMLASLVVALVLFESFVTRGGIWISVHSFIASGDESAFNRFTEVLQDDTSVRGFFIMLLSVMGVTVALTLRALSRWPTPAPIVRRRLADFIDEDSTMYAAVFTLLLILAITLVLLFMGVNGEILPATFNSRLAPLGLLMATVFLIANFRKVLNAQTTVKLTLAVVVISILGGLIGSQMVNQDAELDNPEGGSYWLMGLTLPLFIGVAATILWQLYRLRGQPLLPYAKGSHPWTVHIIHLGMALLLLGYAATTSMGTEYQTTLNSGDTVELGGYDLTLKDVIFVDGERTSRVEAQIEIEGVGQGAPALIIYQMSGQQTTAKVTILHRFQEDIYLVMVKGDPGTDQATLKMQIVPLVSLVWLGFLMIMFAELLLMALEYPPVRHRVLKFFGRHGESSGLTDEHGPTCDEASPEQPQIPEGMSSEVEQAIGP